MKRSGPPRRGTPLDRGTGLHARRLEYGTARPPRKPLPFRSAKQAARDEVIAEAGEAAKARDSHRCQARHLVPTVTCGGALDPQHVIPRGVRKDLADLIANIVAVCRLHHQWIDANPDAARALGLHGRSGDDPDELRARLLRALASAR